MKKRNLRRLALLLPFAWKPVSDLKEARDGDASFPTGEEQV